MTAQQPKRSPIQPDRTLGPRRAGSFFGPLSRRQSLGSSMRTIAQPVQPPGLVDAPIPLVGAIVIPLTNAQAHQVRYGGAQHAIVQATQLPIISVQVAPIYVVVFHLLVPDMETLQIVVPILPVVYGHAVRFPVLATAIQAKHATQQVTGANSLTTQSTLLKFIRRSLVG